MVRERFTFSNSILDCIINFNGAVIEQDEQGSILIFIEAYMKHVESIPVSLRRRKD